MTAPEGSVISNVISLSQLDPELNENSTISPLIVEIESVPAEPEGVPREPVKPQLATVFPLTVTSTVEPFHTSP